MRLVVIESPFAAPPGTPVEEVPRVIERNLRYLRACMADCFARGEAPYASHALYTQPGVLDDGKPEDRNLGMRAGFEWRHAAEATVVYTDLGTSNGMNYGVAAARRLTLTKPEHAIEYRTLGRDWEEVAVDREASFVTRWPAPPPSEDEIDNERIALLADVISLGPLSSQLSEDDKVGLAVSVLDSVEKLRRQRGDAP